jgi:hypothetical protein
MKLTSWKTLTAAAVMVLGLSVQAQALNIAPGDAILQGNQTGNSEILAFLAGSGYTLTSAYKQDVGGGETGETYKNSYSTTFSPSSNPTGFTITYGSGPFIGPTAYLVVKDGNQTPAWYFFNLTALGWNGTEQLVGSGFWEGTTGSISHVEILTGPVTVPDGGSMAMLLGLALMGLATARRFAA